MVYTISMAEKPIPHLSEADWKAKIWNMRAVAETKTSNSYDLRYDVRQTRNDSIIRTKWGNYHNNLRLADRLVEVRRCINKISGALENLKLQSELLMAEKFEMENELEKYCTCLSTLSECRFLRDSKYKTNLVNDAVTKEIQMEVDLLETTKAFLSQKCFSAWEQNNRLLEMISKLENDLADKMEAVEIDGNALNLDNTSVQATFKPDVLRTPDRIQAWETWMEMVTFNLLSADNECEIAIKLRDSMLLARQKCKLDYLAQYEATNYALRRRSFETGKLKTELEYQRKNMLDEMQKLSTELDRLGKCKEETIQYLKCAESRLENRNQRPGRECVRDKAHDGLFDEVRDLRHAITELDHKIAQSRSTYNQMETCILEMDTEIKYQEQSMKLDDEALQLHEKLIKMTPISQVDKNIELLNLSKEMPPETPVVR